LRVVVHGEDQHAAGGRLHPHLLQRLQPVDARHVDVEQDHVRLEQRGLAHRGVTVPGRAHDLHVALGVEHRLQPGLQHGVVVGEQNANLFHSGSST